jgi:D-3-phosphoglycerate dehydrogenase / 2-oxoglutarate reductase
MTFAVRTLNEISPVGVAWLTDAGYRVGPDIEHPDAILVRSASMHDIDIPDSVSAVGRAGVGVNNIPVAEMSRRGIPVFNAPGANANAVKELVIAGMLLAARRILPAWDFVRSLDGDARQITEAVEAGKKRFVGFELPGRTLGVVGLGAIGVEVANAALALGMRVIGFDPDISVARAWQLSSGVQQAASLNTLFADADMVTLHVPLSDETSGLVGERLLTWLGPDDVLLNFARDAIVDEAAMLAALDRGDLKAYVTDFPSPLLKDHPAVVALPHLGASTAEAEENSAVMVADSVRAYLEAGVVRHSVNFPDASLPFGPGDRLSIVNANVPGMVGQISMALADADLNIIEMLNASHGDLAYTLVDVESSVPDAVFNRIRAIDGVLRARLLTPQR